MDLAREKKRQIFDRRARRAKQRWFYTALKYVDKKRKPQKRWNRMAWLFFGGTAFGVSWLIWQFTGTGEVRQAADTAIFLDEGEAQERELFGIKIQFNKGQITIFKEKEEITEPLEKENNHSQPVN